MLIAMVLFIIMLLLQYNNLLLLYYYDNIFILFYSNFIKRILGCRKFTLQPFVLFYVFYPLN